eukprot:scaffold245062_cov22-Tisochrysis_lutea.AAC.2
MCRPLRFCISDTEFWSLLIHSSIYTSEEPQETSISSLALCPPCPCPCPSYLIPVPAPAPTPRLELQLLLPNRCVMQAHALLPARELDGEQPNPRYLQG